MTRVARLLRLVPLVLLLAAGAAAAQDGPRVEATVTLVAGQNAYLDAGAADGLAAGDTLAVWRGDVPAGAFVVVSAAEDRAVVAFAGDPFPVTRGARLTLVLPARPPEPPEPEPTEPAARPEPVAERPSLLDRPAATPAASAPRPAPLTGRLQIGVDGFQTTTALPGGQPDEARTFATPFAALSARAGLGGGLTLDVHARGTYRWAEGLTYDRPGDLRLYTLSLTRRAGALDLRAGRFTVEHDPFTGAWDGAALHLGSRARGVGLAAGLQPDYGAGLPTADFPKAAVYAHTEGALGDGVRARVQALAGAIVPRGEGTRARPFAGVQPRLWSRRASLTAEAMVDQDPATGAWTFSRLGARGSVEAAPGLRLHAGAIRRRAYLLFATTQALLAPSTRVGGGASLTLRGGALPGATVRADVGRAWAEGLAPTQSFGGGLLVPPIPGLGLGLSADATGWRRDDGAGARTGLTAGLSLSRAVGGGLVQAGYRYGRSPAGPADVLTTQGLDALLQLPLSPRLALTLQATVQAGDVLRSTRLYTVLWYRL